MITNPIMSITDEQIAEIEADGCYPTADEFRALISRLRAAERDAARWRKARDILTVEAIEIAQSDFINFGLPVAESESLRADEAIDTAMKGDQQ